MSKYFFILGNNPELSTIEIYKTFHNLNYTYTTVLEDQKFLILKTKASIDIADIQERLGGTIKIGKISKELKDFNLDNITDFLNKDILKKTSKLKKLVFGINIYHPKHKKFNYKFFKWGLSLKKQVKKLDYERTRLVNSKKNRLSSVIVKKNKLLEEFGFDINLFFQKDKTYIGYTETVQDFEFYNEIDYGRPASDSKSGMLPPKLAQMMINLASYNKKKKDLQLLDPFCGSGTVLMQALLQGFIHINGSDISAKAIKDTKENIAYISQNFKKKPKTKNIQELDINKLSTVFKNLDITVTEPYLGPALTGNEDKKELLTIHKELNNLYENALYEIHKVLNKNGQLIITLPIFVYKDELIKFDIKSLIKDNFKNITILKKHKDLYTDRKSLIYKRPKQKLWREIFVLKK